jgi:hypothetical protein
MDLATLAARQLPFMVEKLGSPIRVRRPNGERRDDGTLCGVYDEQDDLLQEPSGFRTHVTTRVLTVAKAAIGTMARGDAVDIKLPSGWHTFRVLDFLADGEGAVWRCVLEVAQ